MEQLVDVLHEDESIIVLNKPSGILTQSPPGIDSLEARVREYLRWKRRETGDVYVGVPHRLDRPVSGAMVFALRRKMANRLSKQFERRDVEKTYWAIVEDRVFDDTGKLSDHIRKIPGRALAEVVASDNVEGKPAILRYHVRQRFSKEQLAASWVEIELETGRTHQIRLQFSSRGHAVLGDDVYGSVQPFGPAFDDARERQIALHARRLSFCHPKTREMLQFQADIPDAWRDWDPVFSGV